MGRHSKQGQGQPKHVPPSQNTEKGNVNNRPPTPPAFQDNSMMDILGSSRDLLYGANVPQTAINPTSDMTQQPPPIYDHQNQSNVAQMSSAQTTQTVHAGQMPMPVPFVNTGQYNGQPNQPYNNQTAMQYNTGMQRGAQTANSLGPDSPMPVWASGLCQQIGNLQNMLGEHAKRWQTIENSIVAQNENLNSMGKQLSEISNLKKELIITNTKVYDVENEIKSLQTQMTDYNEAINQYSDMYDEITTNNDETDTKIKSMDSRLRSLEGKIDSMDKTLKETNDKLTDVRWRSMRENLLFFGIKESGQPGEDCEKILTDFIRDEMSIQETISFDRVHRLGRYNHKNVRPRPIVAKFTFYKERELVRLTAPQTLGGTRFGVSEQYPAEIEEKRRPLYGIVKKARENKNNKVKLIKDKLYINDELYESEENRSAQKYTYTRDRSENRPMYTNTRRYLNSNSNEFPRGQNNTWGSRVFTRSTASTVTNANRSDNEVQTRNRYSLLGEMTQHTTPDVRQARGAKNKAKSPLENENTAKKQNLGENESLDDTLIDVDMTPTQSHTQQSPSLLDKRAGAANGDETQSPVASLTMTLQPSPILTLPTPTHDRPDESIVPRATSGDQSGDGESA